MSHGSPQPASPPAEGVRMTMDFFQHQQDARWRTTLLVIGFVIGVISIVLLLYTLTVITLMFAAEGSGAGTDWLFHPELFLGILLFTTVVVGGTTLFKISQLSSGGKAVAEMMRCRLVQPNSTDPDERKLLNVVEEMAIASGTPVPPVYLMADETGINAFAAGYSSQDAVIGVTRGCMVALNRDELQGVVAHEFAHILNGDMRLNIRLMGVIYGIVMLSSIGLTLFRTALIMGPSRPVRSSGRGDRGGDPRAVLFIIAGILIVVGWIGYLISSILKSAISRQREYLADAAAVQFTRNPSGIGGALRKIGGMSRGSTLLRGEGSEISHMLFSQGFTDSMSQLFSTHPPLPERIRRIDPSFDGRFPKVEPVRLEPKVRQDQAPDRKRAFMGTVAIGAVSAQQIDGAVKMIGQPTQAHIGYARELIQGLPESVLDAVHSPDDARAVVHALLLDQDESIRRTQLDRLASHSDAHTRRMAEKLHALIGQIPEEAMLMTVDLAIPALSNMTVEQYRTFLANVDVLIAANKKITLFEWSLRRVLVHHLERRLGLRAAPRASIYNLNGVRGPLCTVLSTLARVGSSRSDEVNKAFAAGCVFLQTRGIELLPASECGLGQLDHALDSLEQLTPRAKQRVVGAMAACISANLQVNRREGELLRAICDTLDCPMPPLLPGQKLGQ
ncbi:MAG: M48 family metallopeptidase [Phycisphaeraceae bacterium]|nr:M48 family metallopeptidase [Phycisphaeraceae bacterium]